MKQEVEDHAIITPEDDTYRAYVASPQDFVIGVPTHVGSNVGHITPKDNHSVCVRFAEQPVDLEEPTPIRQQVPLHDAPHLCDNLTDYWTQYWRVDDPNRDIPPAFQEFLETIQPMPEFQVEVKNPRLWQFAIDSQKSHSARRVDGSSSAELQQLPPLAIEHLCDIMADMSKFPAWIMVTLTVVLPKVPGEITASQVRSITLFAQLYRTWSRVVSQQVLAKFASFMPSNKTGFLKHRGPMDASMMFAHFLAKAYNAGTAYLVA